MLRSGARMAPEPYAAADGRPSTYAHTHEEVLSKPALPPRRALCSHPQGKPDRRLKRNACVRAMPAWLPVILLRPSVDMFKAGRGTRDLRAHDGRPRGWPQGLTCLLGAATTQGAAS